MNKKIKTIEKYMEEYTPEEKKIIRKQFFPPQATDVDMMYCMNVAKQLGLNPIMKEIYFIERKQKINGHWVSKIEPMLGRNSYLTIAHRSGKFNGMESWAELKEVPHKTADGWELRKELVGIAIVYHKDMEHPIRVESPYSEYVQRKSNGEITSFWQKMPITMIIKVAESQALRKAFNIRGGVDFYEEGVDDEIVTESVNIDENQTEDAGALLAKNKTKDEVIDDNAVQNIKNVETNEHQDEKIIDIDEEN